MRVCWDDRVFGVFRFISVAVPVFVLDILLQLQILQPKWKGTMANDRAVANGLNGYQSFRPSAHEYSIVSFGLGLKLSICGLVENALFRSIFDRSIRRISNSASQREKNKKSDCLLIATSTGRPRLWPVENRQNQYCRDNMDHELGAVGVTKI